ncbi:MAG: (2Fe-2S)-binding protein [Bryobacteraceae bacterium]
MTLRLKINGRARTVDTDPRRTLLEVLREDLKLTGTKYGCGEGQCRACTVLADGQPAASCQMPVSRAVGRDIVTIEGLSASGLHPVQQAFLDEQAMQCGYCVPGMILAAAGLLKKNPRPSESQIVEWMNGNLCRCCGYPKIVAAVRRAAEVKS